MSGISMIDGWRVGEDLEGSDRALTEVLSWYLSGGTEENNEKPC
jgi:hypothetical protein